MFLWCPSAVNPFLYHDVRPLGSSISLTWCFCIPNPENSRELVGEARSIQVIDTPHVLGGHAAIRNQIKHVHVPLPMFHKFSNFTYVYGSPWVSPWVSPYGFTMGFTVSPV